MTDLLQLFSSILDPTRVSANTEDRLVYGSDTSRNFKGEASLVVFPKTTEEVAEIVLAARKHSLALIPSGGRTGLCGGATALNGEVVVSLEKMNSILEIRPVDRFAFCQAGVTTQKLKEALAEYGLDFPVSLASQGTSQLGGNVATNAGGIHVLRYGHTREWVKGVTVVTGEGTILRTGKALLKDNTGYDLRSLFIGSEGTLGIITELILSTTSKPNALTRVLCGLRSMNDILSLLAKVRTGVKNLSAFEFFTDRALLHVTSHRALKNPFAEQYPCYVLIELEGDAADLQSALESFFMPLLEDEVIQDVVIAQSSKQSDELMNLREFISETLSSHFVPHKNDISVPVESIPDFCAKLELLLSKRAHVTISYSSATSAMGMFM